MVEIDRHRIRCLGFALCASLAGAASAGVIRHDVADSEYLALATQPEYESIGSVQWTESGLNYLGSGAYLGDGWVLTAAHVADGTDYQGGGQSNWRFSVGGSTYYPEEIYIHPDWTASSGDLGVGADLALVRLTTDTVPVDSALLYELEDEVGQVATMVGYGATGTGTGGYLDNSSGQKRAGQNVVDTVGGGSRVRGYDDRILFVDFDSPDGTDSTWGASDPLALEYLTAPGDSGGGLFLDVDGQSYLAGVTSFGLAFDGDVDSDYGDTGGYIRVSQHLDWIDGISGILSAQDLVVLEGDFNGDGVVDASDYTLWKESLGDVVTVGVGADANQNGVIDQGDYDIWLANYGLKADDSASSSVPEPSAALLLVGLAALAAQRRRGRPAPRSDRAPTPGF